MDPIGLYLHIPFCAQKCGYCDFYSLPAGPSTKAEYVVALCAQLRAWGTRLRCPADSIYIGGGTPTALFPAQLCEIITQARRCFDAPDTEITVEVNPGQTTPELFRALCAAGVTRVSIGLQSANAGELQWLTRRHSPGQALVAAQGAKAAGIRTVSLDLMLGLSGQTTQSLRRSIDYCQQAGAEHVSAYLLKIEPGTAFYARRDALHLPGEEELCELYLFACERLESHGYRQYEISNFARPGHESRHNLKYWTGGDYLGLGPGGHSFLEGHRFYIPRDVAGFVRCEALAPPQGIDDLVGEGNPALSLDEFSCTHCEALAPPQVVDDGPGGDFAERLMLGLRLMQGLDLAALGRQFCVDIRPLLQKASPMAQAGLLVMTGEVIRLTPKGCLVSNQIIAKLLG